MNGEYQYSECIALINSCLEFLYGEESYFHHFYQVDMCSGRKQVQMNQYSHCLVDMSY